jgi:hypothetical protein
MGQRSTLAGTELLPKPAKRHGRICAGRGEGNFRCPEKTKLLQPGHRIFLTQFFRNALILKTKY